MKPVKLILLLLMAVSLTAYTQEIKATVTEVVDGNTIRIETRNQENYTVLLHGIDSPEPGQPHADQSTEFLKRLLLHKHVTIDLRGRDRHGNRVGRIHIDGVTDPRHEMVKAGMAWTDEKQADPELEALKEEARQKNLGLWQEENPTPPWAYRRQQTMMEAKGS